MTLSDPLHKNEEKVVKQVVKSSLNDELRGVDGESSDSSVNSSASKKSYVSIASSPAKNIKNADIFDKKHELKTAEERRISLQLQLQNLIKNSIIRKSKRLSGEQNNFFEFDNKKNVNIIQRNKKVKIDVENIEILEKLNSEKLVNKKINNIMKINNRQQNQNIRINNYKNVDNTNSATRNSVNKKNNVNNINNIKKLKNNKSLRKKEDDEFSQSSVESEGSAAEQRFFKNRLLIYDDIVVTYNRLNNNDEKSLLNTQNLSVKPVPDTKQNSFVTPFPIINTKTSNTNVADNVTVDKTSETLEICNHIVNQSDNFAGQQRRTMMNKFMTNVNSSTSMYWKEDLPGRNKTINNKSPNMNSSIKSAISNNSKNSSTRNSIANKRVNRATNVNGIVPRKSMDKTSNVDNRSNNIMENSVNNSDSCSIGSRGNNSNESYNSAVFSPNGLKQNRVEQQNVEAILNNDDERFENDNTTNNNMNFNNDKENNVLSRSIK
jgi:hypothetical protein